MARYKFADMSPRLLPAVLESQLIPGSFAHAVHYLIDALDLSGFDARKSRVSDFFGFFRRWWRPAADPFASQAHATAHENAGTDDADNHRSSWRLTRV